MWIEVYFALITMFFIGAIVGIAVSREYFRYRVMHGKHLKAEGVRFGTYRKRNGKDYTVFDIAEYTETGDVIVLYFDNENPLLTLATPITVWEHMLDRHKYEFVKDSDITVITRDGKKESEDDADEDVDTL